MRVKCLAPILLAGVMLVPLTARAQSTPFLTHDEIHMLVNELSGDRSYEHIRGLSPWHRDSGTEGYFKAADYIINAAKEIGLEDVQFIEQPLMGPNYTARSAELWMLEPIEIKLADIGDHALFLADGSHDADVTADLVWIGDGSKLDDLDVAGKIVLTSTDPYRVVEKAVWEKGALGIVSYATSEGRSMLDFPDQIAWKRIPITPPEGKQGTFAFVLPPRKGEKLRQILESEEVADVFATGIPVAGGKIKVKAKVDTEIGEAPGRTGFVEAWIKGSKYHDQQIIITAHLQEEQGSANDDGSGCGNLLEIARTFKKLIAEGKMEPPLRDIRFWWTDEIYSEFRYFQDNPDDVKNFMANLHQDMVGAKFSLGSRSQHLIYAPFSMTSYLDTLFRDIGRYLIYTNNPYLAAGRAGRHKRPHSKPIYAARGTHEGYRAEFVPYFGSSDNLCFVNGRIKVPAVALINWDDYYIHSSDDDLDTIDQTQLERNAFYIAAMAMVLAKSEPTDVPLFAGETYAHGSDRLAEVSRIAMSLVRNDPSQAGWKDAMLLIEESFERERRALQSVKAIAREDNTHPIVADFLKRLDENEKQMVQDVKRYYSQTHGSNPPKLSLTKAEQEAQKKTPIFIGDLAGSMEETINYREGVELHPIMIEEALNYVDGERDYYAIYRAIRAESLATGGWYYGDVPLEQVVTLLDQAIKAEMLKLK